MIAEKYPDGMLFEAVRPTDGIMLPNAQRRLYVEKALGNLGNRFSGDKIDTQVGTAQGVRRAAAYALRDVYPQLVETDADVDYRTSTLAADNLGIFADLINKDLVSMLQNSDLKGALSEVAVLKTFWSAIADGYLESGYALMPSAARTARQNSGTVSRDIDIYGKTYGKPFYLQVKTSDHFKRDYGKDITVVSAEELVSDTRLGSATTYLLQLHHRPIAQREPIYRHLLNRLDVEPREIHDLPEAV